MAKCPFLINFPDGRGVSLNHHDQNAPGHQTSRSLRPCYQSGPQREAPGPSDIRRHRTPPRVRTAPRGSRTGKRSQRSLRAEPHGPLSINLRDRLPIKQRGHAHSGRRRIRRRVAAVEFVDLFDDTPSCSFGHLPSTAPSIGCWLAITSFPRHRSLTEQLTKELPDS